jgi:hypothetical protein
MGLEKPLQQKRLESLELLDITFGSRLDNLEYYFEGDLPPLTI